jgi:hypothetical protein
MNDLKKYLEDYFADWDLSEDERKSVSEICEKTSENLSGFYDIMKKMIENTEYREEMIDIVDKTISEKKDDDKTDT